MAYSLKKIPTIYKYSYSLCLFHSYIISYINKTTLTLASSGGGVNNYIIHIIKRDATSYHHACGKLFFIFIIYTFYSKLKNPKNHKTQTTSYFFKRNCGRAERQDPRSDSLGHRHRHRPENRSDSSPR